MCGEVTIESCFLEGVFQNMWAARLSLRKSSQVVDHNPTGFQWGYGGSGPAQLAAAILYEITDNPELTRTYYQLFKFDHVAKWDGVTFEISEDEVRTWLQEVGAPIEPPNPVVRHSETG